MIFFNLLVGEQPLHTANGKSFVEISEHQRYATDKIFICFIAPWPSRSEQIVHCHIFCLLFLIWCGHQHHTFLLLALRPVQLDPLGAVELPVIAYVSSFFLMHISAIWLWANGIEFSCC